MGDTVPISYGKGSNKAEFGLLGVPENVNAYVKDLGNGTKTGFSTDAINGKTSWATLTNGDAIRAMLDLDSVLLVVSGRQLFAVGPGGTPVTLIGGVPVEGFVTMERNRRASPQAVIVCAGLYFVYDAGTLTQGADADLPAPIAVLQHSGYFIFLSPDGRWFISGIDAVTVDGLDFTKADSKPDGLVMGAVRGPDVILFGSKSADVYNNTGAADFPYTRLMALNVGCWCAGSVKTLIVQRKSRLIDSVIWAATDKDGAFAGVYVLDGFTPVKISTDEVDRLIRDEPSKDNISSMVRTEDGHVFYTLSGATWTMEFDTRTGFWHRLYSHTLTRWRYSCHAHFQGQHVFGHYSTNKVHLSGRSILTEDGDPINWIVQTPTVHTSPHKMRVNALHIGAVTGVGAVSETDEDANPVLLLDYSKDGGASFAAQRRCSLGAAAQSNVRIKERAFGIMDEKGMTIRMQCSAAVVKSIQELAINIDKLGT